MGDERDLDRRAYELFMALADLEGDALEVELLRATRGDAELEAELRSLLRESAETGDFLAAPLLSVGAGHPTRVGPYRIVKVLGEGGMGTVYLAMQDEPVHRSVALKVIKLGMDTRKVQARFQRERQALALMSHPGISQVFDAGATSRGQAYFAMEYVEGEPITDFVESRGLGLGERIGLFIDVCGAVEHAHAKGILHRDLKPSNVLVSTDSGGMRPRVIDFGVARALSSGGVEAHTLTLTTELVGTPDYMSPEQASAGGPELDARSDVYSLGVLLFEVVTGARPYHVESASGIGVEDLRVRILKARPARPSRVKAGLPTELDWIVLRALAPERDRRYRSARELGEDLGRMLRHEPVTARAPTFAYRVRKFCQRHARAMKPAAGMLLALIAALVGGLVYIRGVNDELSAKDSDTEALRFEHHLSVLSAELGRLRSDARELWPAAPSTVPRIEAWLGEADALAREIQGLEGEAGPELLKLQAALDAFLEDDTIPGSLPSVRARRDLCELVAEESLVAGAGAWRAASAAIADRSVCPLYEGLEVSPQVGLVPLGRDPASTLYEFLVVGTGRAPERGPEGHLAPGPDIGIVLVLLPGGAAHVGSDGVEFPAAPHLEKPDIEVELEPFFMAKYELSKGQSMRLQQATAPPGLVIPPPLDRSLPAEPVKWLEGTELLLRLGLELPTEVQWEYAARAGTRTPWSSGADPLSLRSAANLFDQAAKAAGITRDDLEHPEPEGWDDGWSYLAPIGSYSPNAFGLYDVAGNVYEWCRDELYMYDDVEHQAGTGLVVLPEGQQPSGSRVVRGGSYLTRSEGARTAIRGAYPIDGRAEGIGLRPARALE